MSDETAVPSPPQPGFQWWRRSRPFWGGLLLILSGLELLASGNLQPSHMTIHFGIQGFLGYVVPAIVIVCGALAWASPRQNMFYGIIGLLAALYSVISVNLGGFLIGLLLGIAGGALTIAWVPWKRAPHEADATATAQDTDTPDTDTLNVNAAGTDEPESDAPAFDAAGSDASDSDQPGSGGSVDGSSVDADAYGAHAVYGNGGDGIGDRPADIAPAEAA